MSREFTNVSVIVPAYEAAGTIKRTLISIARQTLKPRQVVVVDDGSRDGTREAAEACTGRMNGIDLLVFGTDENLGAGAARNRAIAESAHPVLAFLDADDEWLAEKLERSMARLEGSKHVLVAHDYITGDGPKAPRTECARRSREGPDPFVTLYRKGYIPSSGVVARKDTIIAGGGFDTSLRNAQDFDLWLAMLRRPGTTFEVFADPLLRYHVTAGGIMSHTGRRLRCCMEIAVRYYPELHARPGPPLPSLWYRVAAIHLEAVRAYVGQGNVAGALGVLALFPVRLVTASFRCMFLPPRPRGRFLETSEHSNVA